MATPSVSFDGTRVSAAETETDGGTWDEWDSSKSPALEPDFYYQAGGGTDHAISLKVGTSEAGVELQGASPSVDYAGGGAGGADRVVLFKTIATNYAALNVQGSTGMVHYIGSGTTTARYNYYTHGNDAYPLAGGFVFDLIDPNIAAYRDATDGSPNLNAVTYYAVSATFSSTSKAENVALDAIDYFDVGAGLTLIGGDGVSADAVFDDFVSFDEGTLANRYGIVRTIEGIIYALGYLSIGTSANETDFTDETGGTMVFPDSRYGPGTVGISWNIENANSVHVTSDWSFVGRGSTTDADSRPDYDVTGAGASASATFNGCAWRVFRNWTMNTKATYDGCTFADGLLITHNTATITNCKFQGSTSGDGVAYLTTTDTDNISDSEFVHSDGHAIVITDNTASPMNIDNLTFTGYSGTGNDAAIYNNSGGAITLESINGSSGITVRNGASATTTVNDSQTVTVSGLTEGTAVKIIADETVGTVTTGDVLSSGFANNSGIYTYSQNYEGAFDPSGLDVILRARNAGVATACIANDGGAFTDETEEGSSNTTADMTLLPATPVANDAYQFGHQEQFTRLKLDISTALAFSVQPTVQWQYWNGTIWTALSGVTDGTSGLENSGENIVSWTLPGNWATRTDNSQGPFYYVRAQLTVLGTISTVPVGRKVTLDVSRYLPYVAKRVISSSGLSDVAAWTQDTVGRFAQT